MTQLTLQAAPLNDGSPAPATKLMSRILRTLVLKLGTTDIDSSSERYDLNNVCTGQVLKLLRTGDNF